MWLFRGERTFLSVVIRLQSPGESIFEKWQSRRFSKTFSKFFCTNLFQRYYLTYTANGSENITFLTFVGITGMGGLKIKYRETHDIFEGRFHPLKIIGHSIFLARHRSYHAFVSFIEKKVKNHNFRNRYRGEKNEKIRVWLKHMKFLTFPGPITDIPKEKNIQTFK